MLRHTPCAPFPRAMHVQTPSDSMHSRERTHNKKCKHFARSRAIIYWLSYDFFPSFNYLEFHTPTEGRGRLPAAG